MVESLWVFFMKKNKAIYMNILVSLKFFPCNNSMSSGTGKISLTCQVVPCWFITILIYNLKIRLKSFTIFGIINVHLNSFVDGECKVLYQYMIYTICTEHLYLQQVLQPKK